MRVEIENAVEEWMATTEPTAQFAKAPDGAAAGAGAAAGTAGQPSLNSLSDAALVVPTNLFAKAKQEAYMVMRKVRSCERTLLYIACVCVCPLTCRPVHRIRSLAGASQTSSRSSSTAWTR
jgi:hypothetical protein